MFFFLNFTKIIDNFTKIKETATINLLLIAWIVYLEMFMQKKSF